MKHRPSIPWDDLTSFEQRKRTIAREVVAYSRWKFLDLWEASAHFGADPYMVMEESEAYNTINYEVLAEDHMHIKMQTITTEGRFRIETNSSLTRQRIAKHAWAVDYYLTKDDESYLDEFEGEIVKDANGNEYTLETDPEALRFIDSELEGDITELESEKA